MEFEAPSVWRIASKHTVTFHNLAALGLKRRAAILVDLAEVDAETPTGTRRRLGQSLEKPCLSGAELKVRIQLPPAESVSLRISPTFQEKPRFSAILAATPDGGVARDTAGPGNMQRGAQVSLSADIPV